MTSWFAREADLTRRRGPQRDRRKALEAQISKLQSDPKPKADSHEKITALSTELHQVTNESSTYEASLEALKRTKLKAAFATHFAAMREYGEKLAILSGYGELLLEELDDGARKEQQTYEGNERTAWIRGAAAESLANYKGPLVPKPSIGGGAPGVGSTTASRNDSLSDTRWALSPVDAPRVLANGMRRSFGETHRNEMASLPSPAPGAGPSPSPFGTTKQAQPSTSAINHAAVLPGASPAATAAPPQLPQRQVSGNDGLGAANLSPHSAAAGSSEIFSTPTGLASDDKLPSIDAAQHPSPPVGAHPTVAEIGGAVPQGTGGPASGQLPPRNRPTSKADEAAQDAVSGGMGYQDHEGQGGLGREASTSQRRPGAGEDLPAYSIQDDASR